MFSVVACAAFLRPTNSKVLIHFTTGLWRPIVFRTLRSVPLKPKLHSIYNLNLSVWLVLGFNCVFGDWSDRLKGACFEVLSVNSAPTARFGLIACGHEHAGSALADDQKSNKLNPYFSLSLSSLCFYNWRPFYASTTCTASNSGITRFTDCITVPFLYKFVIESLLLGS